MTRKTLSLALAASALTAFAAPALAEAGNAPNIDSTKAGAPGAVAQFALALELYAYGLANKDALSVLSAARIAGKVDAKDADREKETAAIAGATPSDDTGGADAPADATAMLAAAKDLAGGDAALLGLISDAETEGSRGRIGGASKTLSRLKAGYYDTWKIRFYGGELAEIAIVGDGDADLDAVVTDEYGNVACRDTSTSDKLYCSFTPVRNGTFYVKVSNEGRVRNSYYLLTN